MSARTIDGKALAEQRRIALRTRVDALVAQGVQPRLVAISVGEDAAWAVYQKRQRKSCAELSIDYQDERLPADAAQEDLNELIETCNADAAVHGIIVQAPLPGSFSLTQAQSLISPAKDVEGVSPANLGLVLAGRSGIAPCTARSAFALAEHAMGELRGVEAVVVGASVIAGRPVAQLLIEAGATVRVCHIDTRDLAAHTREAELLVVAVGKAGLIGPDMVRPGATVIDVGINRVQQPDGKSGIVGDVAPAVAEVAGALSPVPGGVGSLTTTILLEHTVAAAERLQHEPPALEAGALARILGSSGQDIPPATAERLAALLSSHIVPGTGLASGRSALERRLARGVLVLDGGVSTELQRCGVPSERCAEANLEQPDQVQAMHEAFIEAGAEAITVNSFAINRHRCGGDRERVVRLAQAAARLARHAARGRVLVLASIGPPGPVVGADLDVEAAEDAFAEVALALADAGVDGFFCETMRSTTEAAAALRGVRRVSNLPVLVSRCYDRDDPRELADFVRAMQADGASAIGLNCVGGPRALLPALRTLTGLTDLPVLARPNAGHPRREQGRLVYHLRPEWLAEQARAYVEAGVRVVGGCCGVGPEHIRALAAAVAGARPQRPEHAVVPVAHADGAQDEAKSLHPFLHNLRTGRFPVLALLAGRSATATAAEGLERLCRLGVEAVGLTSAWPGSGSIARLPARLRQLQDRSGKAAVLELEAASLGLLQAQEALLSAHLLDLRLVLVDVGVFASASAGEAGGSDPERLLQLIDELNHGRDVAGSRIEEPCDFTVGVRLPIEQLDRVADYITAGADFATVQPVYGPKRFREAMARWTGDIPLLAEILVLPDAATAEELDNEVPALSVPSRLKRRLAEDPDEDVRGVLRFLGAWHERLAGACLILPDERVDAAAKVLAGLRERIGQAAAEQ